MTTYNRRTFLNQAALLTVTAATSPVWIPSVTGNASNLSQQVSDHPFFAQAKNHPEVIAHRGGNGQWPGETMFAYKEAMKIGVDVLEMDVYLTKDGQLALMHDKDIKTTTSGKGSIHQFTLAELQKLSAAYDWAKDGGKKFYHKKLEDLVGEPPKEDLRVPSLKEVFEAFPQMRMVIEMKPADLSPASALCQLIRDYRMTDKVLVGSFSGRFIEEFRRLCGQVATSTSLSGKDFEGLIVGASDANAVVAPYQLISKRFVKRVRERNLKLHAWTVNNSDDMNRMTALGVDGIITDYPGALLGLLNRTSRKLG